jgi:hypothetical protein
VLPCRAVVQDDCPTRKERGDFPGASARWFLPESVAQLRIRRAALRVAQLPLINRYVAGILAGKSSALVADLHPSEIPLSDIRRVTH